VDPRIFRKHQKEADRFQIIASGSQSSSQLKDTRNEPDSVESFPNEREKRRIRAVGHSSDDDDDNDDNKLPLSDNKLMSERPGRRKRTNKILDDMILDDDNDDDDSSLTDGFLTDSNRSLTEDDDKAFEASETFANDNRGLSKDEILIKQFTAPDFDDLNYESDHGYIDTNIDFNDSWILLWIFKYQTRFHLLDVAINSLIKFFKMVLLDADQRQFENFPTSSYMAKKLLKSLNKKRHTQYVQIVILCIKFQKFCKTDQILSLNVDMWSFQTIQNTAKDKLVEQN
jgi:hypothetical protein